MFWHKLFGAVAVVAIVLAVPVVLLLSNLYLLATPAFLRVEYGKAGFPESTGFTVAERLRNAEATLTYLRSSQNIRALQTLEAGDESLYNTRELVHLVDVKRVMYWTFFTFWTALAVLVLASIYVLWRPDLRANYPVYLFRGCLILGALLLVIGAVALFSFTGFFYAFHRLFFWGDSWLFAAGDSLIRLFPLRFWIDATLTWAVLAFLEAVLVGAAAYLWPGWQRTR